MLLSDHKTGITINPHYTYTPPNSIVRLAHYTLDIYDILMGFCDAIDSEGCPYIKHIWGDYYTPDEWDCPADFTPDDGACPYYDAFLEMLDDLNIDWSDYT